MNTEQKTVKVTITAADAMTGEKEGKSKSGVYASLEYIDKKYMELVVEAKDLTSKRVELPAMAGAMKHEYSKSFGLVPKGV